MTGWTAIGTVAAFFLVVAILTVASFWKFLTRKDDL